MGADQKRAILAVIISGVILFSWQYFFSPTSVVPDSVTSVENQNNIVTKDVPETVEINSKNSDLRELNIFKLENANNVYEFNNYLTITNAIFKNSPLEFKSVFKEKDNNSLLFNIDGSYKKLFFNIKKINNSTVEINTVDNHISGKVFIDDLGFFVVQINSQQTFSYKFDLKEKEEELTGGKQKLFSIYTDSLSTTTVGGDDKGDMEIKWFAIDFNYHLFATVLDKKPMVYDISESGNFDLKDVNATTQLTYKQIYVKKEYDYLTKLGSNLHLSVDFGIWSLIAVPILRGLQFFYSLMPNYGISIIILTLLIRMLTFPLQYKSFKSMKKMQQIQPELTKIREKFKADPQKMQQETMALFKKAGANPLGGCLPMLLQMPIFFAFYRVLYSSVELVDAPFYFWIVDLSEKDPYYVLPVLMALAMFFHQKLTPMTTADPAQQKIMLFMPLIFAVFMKDFPAGLTLYIFVSTIVAMLQQLFVFKRS